MPLELPTSAPTVLIHRRAFERAALTRSELDVRFNLAPDEFRVEGEIIVIGPLFNPDAVAVLTGQLEARGLVFFDDFFEMSGNWPDWCRYTSGGHLTQASNELPRSC